MSRNANTERLGRFLRATRTQQGLSLRQLSERSGVSRSTIGRLEAGDVAHPRPDVLAALALVLAIATAELYTLAEYHLPKDMPSFDTYLRTCYRELSPESIAALEVTLEQLVRQDQGNSQPEAEWVQAD
ncbi:MAG: helix-turn-helix transcriptional regulator [Actinomycetes bacterium]